MFIIENKRMSNKSKTIDKFRSRKKCEYKFYDSLDKFGKVLEKHSQQISFLTEQFISRIFRFRIYAMT